MKKENTMMNSSEEPTLEEWRPIKGLEGYEVSDIGRVRSLTRRLPSKNGSTRLRKGQILKPNVYRGRQKVHLSGVTVRVHELVCAAFWGERPSSTHYVKHLNGDRLDNTRGNLAWKGMDEIVGEEWRAVKGFESSHEVSNTGRVRSLDHTIMCMNNGTMAARRYKGQEMTLGLDKDGYPTVSLKSRSFHVHVLVATAFVGDKPSPKHKVRHLNSKRADNRPCNLAWGTAGRSLGVTMMSLQKTSIALQSVKAGKP